MSRLDQYIAEGERIAKRTAAGKEYRLFQAQLNKDLKKIKRKLAKLPISAFPVEAQEEVLRHAAKPLVTAAQEKAPIMKDRAKVTVSISGRRYEYYPGNLKASIQEIRFKRRASNVTGKAQQARGGTLFFGPKVSKRTGRSGKVFRYGKNNNSVDAFYAAMVEFGTSKQSPQPFMRPAFDQTKGLILSRARRGIKRLMDEWKAKNTVK